MEWVQNNRFGTTNPTPLPEPVGANKRACWNPSATKYPPLSTPNIMPSFERRPARFTSACVAHVASPNTLSASGIGVHSLRLGTKLIQARSDIIVGIVAHNTNLSLR